MGQSKDKKNRLNKIFESYSLNLSKIVPSHFRKYACPLCLNLFTQDAIDNNLLTEEHIISRKLGGKLITLTCKDCNSRDGSDLDANLINEFRAKDGVLGLGSNSFRGLVKVENHKQDVQVFFSKEENPKIHFVGDIKRANPRSVEFIKSALENNPQSVSFTSKFNYIPLKADIAKIRSAYLLMFYYFGYEYILNENLIKIREQISESNNDLIISKAILNIKMLPEQISSICIVKNPKELKSFVVNFSVKTEVESNFSVIMPGLNKNSENIYERWEENKEKLKALKIHLTFIIPNPNAPLGFIYDVGYIWNIS